MDRRDLFKFIKKKIFKVLKLGQYNSKMSYANQSQLSNKIIMYIQIVVVTKLLKKQ